MRLGPKQTVLVTLSTHSEPEASSYLASNHVVSGEVATSLMVAALSSLQATTSSFVVSGSIGEAGSGVCLAFGTISLWAVSVNKGGESKSNDEKGQEEFGVHCFELVFKRTEAKLQSCEE